MKISPKAIHHLLNQMGYGTFYISLGMIVLSAIAGPFIRMEILPLDIGIMVMVAGIFMILGAALIKETILDKRKGFTARKDIEIESVDVRTAKPRAAGVKIDVVDAKSGKPVLHKVKSSAPGETFPAPSPDAEEEGGHDNHGPGHHGDKEAAR